MRLWSNVVWRLFTSYPCCNWLFVTRNQSWINHSLHWQMTRLQEALISDLMVHAVGSLRIVSHHWTNSMISYIKGVTIFGYVVYEVLCMACPRHMAIKEPSRLSIGGVKCVWMVVWIPCDGPWILPRELGSVKSRRRDQPMAWLTTVCFTDGAWSWWCW